MFLLSARRVELEVRSDHDKRNPLPLTKGHCWLLRHLLFRLLVETFPRFLDGLFFFDLHSLQFGPASEWILGLHYPLRTILLFHLLL